MHVVKFVSSVSRFAAKK